MTGEIFRETANLFLRMAPYLILGMLFTGILSIVLKPSFVLKYAGDNSWKSIVKASLFGVPLPLCSCGVLPTALYLRDSGASKPAVQSFLISTPQTGFDSIIATYGILGPVMAIYRAAAAFFLGILGGSISSLRGKPSPAAPPEEEQASEKEAELQTRSTLGGKVRHALRYGFVDFIDDIALQFIIGLLIAGVLTVVIPDDFFTDTALASGISAMLLMVILGTPIYMCSTSSIPIAAALMAKGISPGAAFVLLAAGPATNAATLAVLGKKLGGRETLIYLGSLVAGSLGFGLLLDWLVPFFGWEAGISIAVGEEASELLPDWLAIPSGILLALLLLRTGAMKIKMKISQHKDAKCSGTCA